MNSSSKPRALDPWRRRSLDVLVAIAVGVGAVAGSYAAVGARPSFLAAPVAGWVTAATPDAVVTWAILTLGSLGQSLGFVLALVLTVGAVGAVAVVLRRLGRAVGGDRLATTVAAAVTIGILTAALTASPVSALGAGLGAGIVLLAAGRIDPSSGERASAADRRGFLRVVAAAVAVAGGGALVGSRSGAEPTADTATDAAGSTGDSVVDDLLAAASARTLDLPDLDPLVSQEFYQVDINSVDPDLSAEEWSLRVTGAVDEEREFTYDQLTGEPAQHRFVTLQCVGDALNGKKIDTALWTGVPIARVLPDLPDECCVMLRAADDYFEEFPMAALRRGFLAYRMNGQPLPRGHGHPVRALIPGHWGEINVKWLTEIEVLEEPADGYWEQRGWHGTGPVNTVAKLHSVSKTDTGVRVGGHAYAGTRGIDRVEVSTDGGQSWSAATLSDPLPGAVDARTGESLRETAEDAWRMWEHAYDATEPHEVVVRAVDGTGDVQSAEERRAFPRGPSGWVSREIDPRRL
ncbi:molybdopterin-dependent oxidoreductase [Salinigranum salinum]|uniref:molybdopterin-dependent oxidoreductase n=1 Tax=Salinigranum salinum TaxID=1364937 RepID=UPI001261075D|nr:molybdopterin-dependent oxidoreductase [Salinigranum salinum]